MALERRELGYCYSGSASHVDEWIKIEGRRWPGWEAAKKNWPNEADDDLRDNDLDRDGVAPTHGNAIPSRTGEMEVPIATTGRGTDRWTNMVGR